jgi:hypothetical protein
MITKSGLTNLCPGKDRLSFLNQRLQGSGYQAVSPRGLSRGLKTREIPAEMEDVIMLAEGLVAG